MDLDRVRSDWQTEGFTVLPGYLPPGALSPVLGELDRVFPSAAGFHEGTDERSSRFLGDEFAGIDNFPFASVELSLLAVCDPIIALARALLGCDDLRLYSAEAWAKFIGAADYDQHLHRDYLNLDPPPKYSRLSENDSERICGEGVWGSRRSVRLSTGFSGWPVGAGWSGRCWGWWSARGVEEPLPAVPPWPVFG